MQGWLLTTSNQFGFKRKHGTDMCVFTLKELIRYYWNGQLVCTPASTGLFVCLASGTVSRLYRHIRQAAIPARVASGIVDFCVTGSEPASVIWTLAGECKVSAFCVQRECVFMLRGRYVL